MRIPIVSLTLTGCHSCFCTLTYLIAGGGCLSCCCQNVGVGSQKSSNKVMSETGGDISSRCCLTAQTRRRGLAFTSLHRFYLLDAPTRSAVTRLTFTNSRLQQHLRRELKPHRNLSHQASSLCNFTFRSHRQTNQG